MNQGSEITTKAVEAERNFRTSESDSDCFTEGIFDMDRFNVGYNRKNPTPTDR